MRDYIDLFDVAASSIWKNNKDGKTTLLGKSLTHYALSFFHIVTLRCREKRYPVLLSASVSDNSGNSPQMAAPRRSCEIDQSTQRFHAGCDNRCLLGNEYCGLHGREF